MGKIDLKNELQHLYTASPHEVALLDVPKLKYLMLDGQGDPNSAPQFKQAVEALYAVAYSLKFQLKKGKPQRDYSVMPLEGLWWTDDMSGSSGDDKSMWHWTLMIAQPPFVAKRAFERARKDLAAKRDVPLLWDVRLESLHEGYCAQVLHVGPYATEARTILLLHQYAHHAGYALAGKHHEIYLSDARRTLPDRMRTILRQPIRRAGAARA